MIVVFISSPYTLGDVAVNVRNQMDAANKLMNIGLCPIVPLFTHFQHMYMPRPYEDWMRIDFEKISRSDCVLRLPGESAGSDKEIEYAKKNNIPVYYTFSDLRSSYGI